MLIARSTRSARRRRTARRLAATAGALGALGLVPATAMAAPGDLDTSFGGGRGFVTTDVVTNTGFHDEARAVAVGPFGDAYVAGRSFGPGGSEVLSLAAYTCCDLDPTFGTRGSVAVQAGSGTTGNDVVYDDRGDGATSNDRLLAGGSIVRSGVRRPFVAAVTRNGRLDLTWSGDGLLSHAVPGASSAQIDGLARQADGRIVAAGRATINGSERGFVARYTAQGRLDASFSGDGVRIVLVRRTINGTPTTARALTANDIAVDNARGRIILTGSATYAGVPAAGDEIGLTVAFRMSDGALDTRWASTGVRHVDLGSGDDRANAIAVQGDGKVVLAGTQDILGNGADTAAVTARLRPDGALDAAYDADGRTNYRPGRDVSANDVVIAATGQIVLALGDRGGNSNADDDDTFTVLRLRSDGSLDATWNGDGEARTNVNPGVGGFEHANAVALRNDSSVIAAGVAAPPGRGFLYAVALYRNR
ncbi:MAG TPA: hypothetical protein VHF51_14175 [Solirubrobacteraceae bacterium]|nr:hypothetical protein [Solirubrobacteraceae bacterium]